MMHGLLRRKKCIICDSIFEVDIMDADKTIMCYRCKAALKDFVLNRRADAVEELPAAGPDENLESPVPASFISREDAARYWLVGAEAEPLDLPEIKIPCPNCKENVDGEVCDWGDYNLSYEQLPQCPRYKPI